MSSAQPSAIAAAAAFHLDGDRAAADPVAGLEHHHVGPGGCEIGRGTESARPTPTTATSASSPLSES